METTLRLSVGILVWGAAAAIALGACSPRETSLDPQAIAVLERIGRQELHRTPEQAERIGVSAEQFGGRFDDLLDDRSTAAIQRARVQHLESARLLAEIDLGRLSPAVRGRVEAGRYVMDGAVRMDRFGYGLVGLGWASPYVINQSDSAYTSTPKFLALHHSITNKTEAQAWLARLAQLDDAIRDERLRFETDVADGVRPPRAILERISALATTLKPTSDPRQHALWLAFKRKLDGVPDLPETDIVKLSDEAAKILRTDITPEYDALIKSVDKAIAQADAAPGVDRIRNGAQWYAEALKLSTGQDITPEQAHQLGLALVKETQEKMGALLVATGRPETAPGAQMRQFSVAPTSLFPDTPEGRAALLASVQKQIDWAQQKLPAITSLKPPPPPAVREAPQLGLSNAPSAYYVPAPLDGSRPASVNINIRSTLDWPSFSLPALAFHEGLPGHHLQTGYARAMKDAGMLQHLSAFPGFSEGWALYAEDLASELGAYDGDPLVKLGYLQSVLFRAARMVADTGIHAKKWSREQAIVYLTETTGLPRPWMESEVDRATIWPGQAAAYIVGREKIRALREDADVELGQLFDLKAFHDAVLGGGARPLPVVERDVQTWVAARKTPAKVEE